jgi:N-methylhydantoinase A
VPRYLTFEIEERIDSEGDIFLPSMRGALAALQSCRDLNAGDRGRLLWSIVNPAHELRVGAMIAETLAGLLTLSHQLNPIVREYRRPPRGSTPACR